MVVIAARQAGPRPESIRTRLAPYWQPPVLPELETDEYELQTAEHLGCYSGR